MISRNTRSDELIMLNGIDQSNTEEQQQCNASDKYESDENLRKSLLLDSATTTELICNKNLVNNIRDCEDQGIISNGGSLNVNQEADLEGVGTVPFSEDAMTNLMSVAG